MTVRLNGEQREIRDGIILVDLIAELGLGARRIAVEVNRDIIAREEYATCRLQAGDEIEIVHFVGGG
jgi:thiamine biosynthesis protein ThiS